MKEEKKRGKEGIKGREEKGQEWMREDVKGKKKEREGKPGQEGANSRVEKLRNSGRVEMRPDEFKERLDVPAYLRKQVRLQSVPPSSEPHVSKYNLNDDSQILGNNRFLHDNVD